MRIKRSLLLTAALGLASVLPVGIAQSSPRAVEASSAVAVSESGSYIVVLHDDPLLGQFEQDQLKSKAAVKRGKAMAKGHAKLMRDAGVDAAAKVHSFTNAVNGFSAIMSHDDAVALSMQKGVAFVIPDELRQLTTDNSPGFLGLDDEGGIWESGYDGEGVVVGVIDSGIWPEHPSVADDGSYPAAAISIDPVDFLDEEGNVVYSSTGCDFGGPSDHLAPGLVDEPFECNNKLIGARQLIPTYEALVGLSPIEYDSARDENGHGTHTLTTAAGNAGVAASAFDIDRGIVSGIAPRAHVVAYKGLGELGGFGSDLAGAIDQAVADGVDVINYSIGSGSFAIGPDDVAFLFAAAAGVHVATSNGNSGPGAATTGSPASVPWLTSVGASTQSRTFEGSVTIEDSVPLPAKSRRPLIPVTTFDGASFTDGVGPMPIIDAAKHGNELCEPSVPFRGQIEGRIVLCRRGAIARVDKSLAVYLAGGAGMVLYNNFDADSEVTDNHWVPSVHINNTDGLALKELIKEARQPVATIAGGVFTEIEAPSMAAFSSRGENRLSSDIIKPDVTAPGVNVLAGNTPTPTTGAPGQYFQSISGTSMSSPHVAGLMTLIDQAHPDWSPAAVKSALMTTSYQDVLKEDLSTPADPFDMGAGHVDPSGAADAKNSLFNPGLVYEAGLFEYAAYTCGADLGIFTPGSCDFLDGAGVPFDASDFNQASIGIGELPGSQTIKRVVTNVSGSDITVEAAFAGLEGISASMSPTSLVVPAGGFASFDVTFDVTTAAADAWSFGSMTLTGDGYEVYSPIGVRPVVIGVPGVVSGEVAVGGASFDVDFGYEGPYAAAPHGLVPATVENSTVAQDPDQTFSPADVGNGATLHEVTTAGAAILRIHVPQVDPDDNIDLDLFVFDPDGNFAGASTNGGTNETVEIVLPQDGTWSIYVHGWGVGADGDTAEYDILTWVLSATPGGNLAIVSAPLAAVLGTSGTIEIEWPTNLADGEFLGAVSHSSDGDLLGLTLVEVHG